MRAPRGFSVTRSDHFGPKTWEKKGARTHYQITWERQAHGAVNLPDTTGFRLYRKDHQGRWMTAGPIRPDPMDAWLART